MTGIKSAKRRSKKVIILPNDGDAAGPDGTPAEAKTVDAQTIGQSDVREQVSCKRPQHT